MPVENNQAHRHLKTAMINMRKGGFISEHDYNIGCRVAKTMCGGDVEPNSLVDEQWLLDLERKNFMELLRPRRRRRASSTC